MTDQTSDQIRYRKDKLDEDFDTAEEERESRREQIQEMYYTLSTDQSLDTLLMMANIFEMRRNTLPSGSNIAQWHDTISMMLRELLLVATHMIPNGPKPDIAFEDPYLYWPSVDDIKVN